MTALASARRRLGGAAPTVAALLGVACYSGVLVWLMSTAPYDIWGGAVFGPLLVVGSLPLLRRAAENEPEGFFWILLAALCLKLLSSIARLVVAEGLYDGIADAADYIEEGARLADAYRQGIFTADVGKAVTGTGGVRVITGVLFAFTGRTTLGGFMVFSWWAFWGLVACYKAFRIALPDGHHQRYARLLLFLPSMLYWPSSVGKDAWMLMGLGVAALGAARLLSHRPGAYPLLGAGLAATTFIRPHISALICVGLATAYVFRRGRPSSSLGPLSKPLGMVVVGVLMVVVIGQAQSYFDVEDEEGTGATTVLDETARRTEGGGSEFEPVNARSVADVPAAILAVMFRPFPWEAHNPQALIASAEGVVMLGLLVTSWRRLSELPRHVRRNPYVALVTVYSLLFCIAFSSFGNFGILTRQRIQLFPFALVLLCLRPGISPAGRLATDESHGSRAVLARSDR